MRLVVAFSDQLLWSCKISTCELNLLIGCVLICFDLQKINASTGKNYLVKLRCRSIVTVIRTGWFHKMTQLCTQYIFATSIRNLKIQCTKSRQSLEERELIIHNRFYIATLYQNNINKIRFSDANAKRVLLGLRNICKASIQMLFKNHFAAAVSNQ